ncbi:RING-H2 finger protein ATL39-like [Typha angustifolia]|uniref:RING-H2 finger protein ATL39-like n=1 Tax=Typha angustifolia TaxID=59011 RepID=UPI003C2EB658
MPGAYNSSSTCTFLVAGLLIVLGILSGVVKYVWILDIVVCVVLFLYFCCTHSGRRAVRADELHLEHSSPPPPAAAPLSSAAAAIPAFVYETTPGEGGAEAASSCSVCLEGVKGGETVRKMPICGHMFHVDCIDMWLGSHSTCPNCRSRVEAPPEEGRTGNVSEPPAPPRLPV